MLISLDATYSVGSALSGIGVYSNEVLRGLAAAHGDARFRWLYRPHRFVRGLRGSVPGNVSRRLLIDGLPRGGVFHGLNQRLPGGRLRRAVSTFHDLFVMTGEYSSAEFRARFAEQARDAAQRSDLIIAVSQFTADQVHDLLRVERSRLRVVHHGVRGGVPAGERERLVLHVGAIQARKNVLRLIRAFEATPRDWRLVLAGSAGYGAEEILRAVRSERIQHTGYVSTTQLEALYARASILAFPSLDEGFGMPVLEAMARGAAVLASNRSALPEVCGDAALLVDPEDEDQIRDGLMRLMEDGKLRSELVERGLRRASEFTWEAAVRKTWSVYEEL